MTLTLFQDKRPIQSICGNVNEGQAIAVGLNDITKIEVYEESGQCGCVPWFAIYKGDFLVARIDVVGLAVIYQEEEIK